MQLSTHTTLITKKRFDTTDLQEARALLEELGG